MPEITETAGSGNDYRYKRAACKHSTSKQQDAGLILLYDDSGREMYFTKEQWLTDVLPHMLITNWNNPDSLYRIIADALEKQCSNAVLEGAKHLYSIDPMKDRGACILGIVLMKEGKLDEAEDVLRAYLSNHGDNISILVNLAKVYLHRENDMEAEKILWHALEVSPSDSEAVFGYLTIQRQRGGEKAVAEALEKIMKLQ